MSLDRNVVLCGFMGCGKSTVGKLLARMADVDFIDMDEYIESREKMTVSGMFELYGEDGFREREHTAVMELSRRRGIVLAAGGGTLTFRRNAAPLKQSGDIVFLNLDFDECYRRIKLSGRPLVLNNTRERLANIYREREKLYQAASDFEVAANGTPPEVAETVAGLLGLDIKNTPDI